MKVHLLDDRDDRFLDLLRKSLDDGIEFTTGPVHPGLDAFDLLIAGRPDRETVEYSPDLRSLVIPFAGLPVETRELMLEFPEIAVYNLHHNALPTAELGLALLMAASKNLLVYDRSLRKGDWTPRYEGDPGIMLGGCRVCVVGFGAVGREAGRLCSALGMDVVGIRAGAAPGETWHRIPVYPSESLEEELGKSNVLMMCVPLTRSTRGMIGSRELSLLQKPSIVVNIARGPVIQEEALYKALASGSVYAAGLDVWYSYPPDPAARSGTRPSQYPFQDLSNVVMSPHRGGAVDQTEVLRASGLAKLVNAAERGEVLWNRVGLERGY